MKQDLKNRGSMYFIFFIFLDSTLLIIYFSIFISFLRKNINQSLIMGVLLPHLFLIRNNSIKVNYQTMLTTESEL